MHHPARQAPLKLALVGSVMMGVAWVLLVWEGSLMLALASIGLLTVSIAPFLFPTRYSLTAAEVRRSSMFGSRRRGWHALRRWQEDPNGILVSPFARPSPLDALRGIYLQGGDRAAIRAVLLERLGPAASSRASRKGVRRHPGDR